MNCGHFGCPHLDGMRFAGSHPMTRLVRVAAVGDLHCGKDSQGAFQPLFTRMAESADVVVLCGDLTDYGLPEEARVLARELTRR